jgi:hypothetical protein
MNFVYLFYDLRVKAIILVVIFLFGGSGLSIDIAKCCDSIAGISLGFSQTDEHGNGKSGCCKVFKSVKKEKMCCENVVINTVINSVPALGSSYKSLKKPIFKIAQVKHPVILLPVNTDYSFQLAFSDASDQQYPVPILIKKRVLQI